MHRCFPERVPTAAECNIWYSGQWRSSLHEPLCSTLLHFASYLFLFFFFLFFLSAGSSCNFPTLWRTFHIWSGDMWRHDVVGMLAGIIAFSFSLSLSFATLGPIWRIQWNWNFRRKIHCWKKQRIRVFVKTNEWLLFSQKTTTDFFFWMIGCYEPNRYQYRSVKRLNGNKRANPTGEHGEKCSKNIGRKMSIQ